METVPGNSWDALEEASKAFANLVLGKDQTDIFRDQLSSYSDLLDENSKLKVEVASLREILPFKDKYENLKKEFLKVTAERDLLSSQALDSSHKSADYERLKSAYQKTKGQLAAVRERLNSTMNSINQFTLLEHLFQGFRRKYLERGLEIDQVPTHLFLQLTLQDGTARLVNKMFARSSQGTWSVNHDFN